MKKTIDRGIVAVTLFSMIIASCIRLGAGQDEQQTTTWQTENTGVIQDNEDLFSGQNNSLPSSESTDFYTDNNRNKPLYEGVYTHTGVFNVQGRVQNSGSKNTFYLKIYKSYLIKTESSPYAPTGSDTKYEYIGNNKNGHRIYAATNNMFKIAVEQDFNVYEIITCNDYRYGNNNVTYDMYCEVVKGDQMEYKTPDEILQEYQNSVEMLDLMY